MIFTSSCLICSGWSLSKLMLFWQRWPRGAKHLTSSAKAGPSDPWRATTDHTRLWDPKWSQSANNHRFFHSTSHQEHPCITYMISCKKKNTHTHTCSLHTYSQHFHYFSYVSTFFRQKRTKKRKNKTSRNIFSIENQMQIIPLARNPKEKQQSHRFAISTQSPLFNSCLENRFQKSCSM